MLNKFLLAISFLTSIPAYGNRLADDKEMAGSLSYYPLVGFIIGVMLAGLAWLSHRLNLGTGGDAMILVLWIIITAGLHLDGLMDTADGLFSGRDRERKLEIMRDSRVGAMGAIALGALLILKFGFLTSLGYEDKLGVLVIAPAFGRTAMVFSIFLFPYARSGPGLGKSFADQSGWVNIIAAAAILLAGTLILEQYMGLIWLGMAALPIIFIVKWIAGQIGGLTGDSYGAICEMSETIFLMAVVIGQAVAG